MLGAGFNVSQVVHDYGDICQAITGLAVEQNAPITVDEFQTLNRSLDTAIAEAVTEHARVAAQTRSVEGAEHLGHAAHELRDILNSALLAFHLLKRGTVAINGNTGAVLGRSLMSLRDIVDRTLAEVRLNGSGGQRCKRLSVATFLDEVAAAGVLHSEYRAIKFTAEPVDPNLTVDGDPQLLSTAVMNLLHNAFKYTHPGGSVVLRARAEKARLVIEVEDECGGIPESKADLFKAFADRRGSDRSGLGLGLSMARKAIRAHQGDIQIRNMPGKGCVFVIEIPLAAEAEYAAVLTTTV
jgi:signal transduction histidine kinase